MDYSIFVLSNVVPGARPNIQIFHYSHLLPLSAQPTPLAASLAYRVYKGDSNNSFLALLFVSHVSVLLPAPFALCFLSPTVFAAAARLS